MAITFIYTRCPLPEFCPLMDRHFAAIQKTVQGAADLADVRLVSMTLDPEFDTPAVLSSHAARLKADPRVWSFVTGDPTTAAQFAQQFGIYTERDLGTGANLTHNLRTAVIDADGRLVDSAFRQRLDAGRSRCRPQSDSRSRALSRSSRRACR